MDSDSDSDEALSNEGNSTISSDKLDSSSDNNDFPIEGLDQNSMDE